MTILDRNSGTFNSTTGVTVTRSTGSFGVGTVIVVAIFGNTVFNTPGSMTQRTSSVVDLGLYSYDKTGAGEVSLPFTATSAGSGVWFCWELSAGSTWLTGSANQNGASSGTYTSTTVTPTVGNRHMLLAVGGVGTGNVRTVTGISDSFTEWADAQVSAQDWPFAAGADRDVVADGVAGYGPTATFSGVTVTARGAVLLAYVNASGATVAFPPNQQVRRRLSTAPRLPRGGVRMSTPVRAQVNPPFPFTGVKQPRGLRGLAPRRGESAMPVPAQVVVTAPKFPPSVVRPRLKGLRLFRGHASAPVPAQSAVVAPAYPPQSVRSRVRGLRLFRGRAAGQIPGQDRNPTPTPPRLRIRGLRVRGDIASPVPPQIVVVPPAYTPLSVRTRLRGLRLFRGHAASPVPPQIIVTPPPYPPSRARQAVAKAAVARRGHVTTPAPEQRPPNLFARLKLRAARIYRPASRPGPFPVSTTPDVQPRTPTVTVDLARVAVAADLSRVATAADLSRVAVVADLSRVATVADLTRPVVTTAL